MADWHKFREVAPEWAKSRVADLPRFQRVRALSSIGGLGWAETLGSAWFACVHEGPVMGFVATVQISPVPDPRLPAAQVDEVRRWVCQSLGLETVSLPGFVRLESWPEGVIIEGRSWQLAAAVAWIEILCGVKSKGPTVWSAALSAQEVLGLEPVMGAQEKAAVVARELGQKVPCLVATEARSAEPWLERHGPPEWRMLALKAVDRSPNTVALGAWQAYQAGRQSFAEQEARLALSVGVSGREKGLATWIDGTADLHQGRSQQAHVKLMEARTILEGYQDDFWKEPHELDRLTASLGVSFLDLGRAEEARQLMEQSLHLLRKAPASRERSEVLSHCVGTLSRTLVTCGRLDEAAHLLETEGLGPRRSPSERCRTTMELAEVYRKMGHHEQNLQWLEESWTALVDIVSPEQKRLSQRYLTLYSVRGGRLKVSYPQESPRWRQWPQPLEVAEGLLRQGEGALGDWIEKELLPDTQWSRAHGLAICGVLARAAVRTGRAPKGTYLTVQRTLQGPPVDGAMVAALEALLRGDGEAWAMRCPY